MLEAIPKISLCLVLSIVLFACKKSSDSPSGNSPHINAKFDGEKKSFSSNVFAYKVQMGDGYNLVITGVNGTSETFNISLFSDMNGFQNGDVFYEMAESNDTENTLAWVTNITNANETSIWATGISYVSTPSNIKVTITEINNDLVKGTFSGTIYQNINNPPSKSITQGEFVAKFKY
jgi:hypothetical protein